MKAKLLFGFMITGFLISGCATYNPYNANSSYDELKRIDNTTTNVFLIGDVGKPEADGTAPKSLLKLQRQFGKANKNDVLLFLGDNIYPKGIPLKNDTAIKEAEHALNLQLEVAKTFPGSVYFLPGNHDWYSGLKGLKRQEKMVEKALGKNTFQPENGCPIEKVNLSDDIIMLIVDSHWYITNWNNHPTINDDCEIKTRADFLDEFRSEIKKARGKTTLVAIHHPMYSNGPHNGRYGVKENMSPIPVLGTIKNILRTTTGIVNADLSNQFYNELRKNLVVAAQQNENVIFLSGHEHNLQYLELENVTQIVSGSGSKTTPVRMRNPNNYGHSVPGYAVLNIGNDKAIDVQYYNSVTEQVEFYKQIKQAEQGTTIKYPEIVLDSVSASIYTKDDTNKSRFYKFLWGERYRDDYSTKVKAKTVSLDTLMGGLKPFRKGGGTQSKTLHLKTADGKRYVMRAMKKQADQFMQAAILQDQYVEGEFINTTTEDLLEDVFAGAYPYAPFTIGTLSDAINLSHLNPKLYYIPKQKALGSYNDDFGNELYLFEEHPSDGHTELGTGNFSGDIVSTVDMLQDVLSDESKIIDEKEFIKARLFDMLIGDPDRHQDQWRWLVYENDKKTIYKPLPRDRDFAFSKVSDGFLFGAGVKLIPAARKYRKYEPDLKDVKGFNVSGFSLDVAFIKEANIADWDEQVQFIQAQITDDVIDSAFSDIPKEVNAHNIAAIKSILKDRRANLQKISDRYIKLINKYAVITGTNKDDYINVKALKDGAVEVSLYRKKDDTIKDRFHHKIYQPQTTKEIWIYGLDDDDSFEVEGKISKIKVRFIGGQNNDDYKVEHGKNIVIYDYKSKKNDLTAAKNARIKLTDDYNTNVYDYRKLKNNTNQIVPIVGANPDDGLKLGFADTYTTYGFERNPFTSQHQFKAAYYFATEGYELDYKGEFANVIGGLNLGFQAHFQSPNYSVNFFGYGNETENYDDDLGLDYYRVKTRIFRFSPQLIWNSKRGSIIHFGISYEVNEIHNTDNRFVSDNNLLPENIFDEEHFGGVNAAYNYANYDNNVYPTNGMHISMETGYKNNLEVSDRSFGYLITDLGFARQLNPSGRLVFATKFKSHLNFGGGFEFYQAASIGGLNGLRGYRNERFTGKNAFYQNTDLRYSFNRIKTQLIPIKLGLYGGFDYGRVWTEDDTSEKWHNAYGGGFFINAIDILAANLGVFNSSDGVRVTFGMGFDF
ncbi:metallophosphoesterase [Winogradskyella psychrotolerans]|uniref:metallophosphoesterase n=1 Tax=Winogradskyella psychrotolerans TaxID=1344585 RepID=UPI001C07146A|nr:metallophosphoesterase [Winogradskyella psychrotolerans]MBU2927777.1 metallophosphoesterase [Winogradskyella psychrotolerans]